MNVRGMDASLPADSASERAAAHSHPSFVIGVVVTLTLAIAAMFAALGGARAGGATSGLPVVASLADAHIGSLLLRRRAAQRIERYMRHSS